MANTYTQIHIQVVTAVKYRQALIHPDWKDSLHKYMTGVIQNHNHKLLAINSMPDHIHIFFGFRPHQALSDLVGIVKKEASEWININHLTEQKFRWQEGYGAFSYTKSLVPVVARYIENQEKHHRKKPFWKSITHYWMSLKLTLIKTIASSCQSKLGHRTDM